MNREDFWTAIEFLVSQGLDKEFFFFEDIDEWLYSIIYKVQVELAKKRIEDIASRRRLSIEENRIRLAEMLRPTISHPGVKTKLEMLMGSNIVRLTDRDYMLKLMAKFRDNHEKQQQKRIEERRKQELTRTKNMILHRFIPVQEAPIELRQYPLFKLYLYCDALMEKKRRAHVPRKVRMSKSLYKSLYPEIEEETIQDEDEDIYVKKTFDGITETMVPLTKEEVKKYVTEQTTIKDIQDGYMMSQEDYDRLHYEADSVKELKKAQTVEELYKKAYEIIGTLYSHMEKEKRLRAEKEKFKDEPEGEPAEEPEEGPEAQVKET